MLVVDALLVLLLNTAPSAAPLSTEALIAELSRNKAASQRIDEQKRLDDERELLITELKKLALDREQFNQERQNRGSKQKKTPATELPKEAVPTPPTETSAPLVNSLPNAALIAKTFQGMKADRIGAVLSRLDPAVAAAVVSKMKKDLATKALETLKPEVATAIALHLGENS